MEPGHFYPGQQSRGKPARRELFGRDGAEPPGGPVAEVSEHGVWAPPAGAWKDASGFRGGFATPCSLLLLAACETEAFCKQP